MVVLTERNSGPSAFHDFELIHSRVVTRRTRPAARPRGYAPRAHNAVLAWRLTTL